MRWPALRRGEPDSMWLRLLSFTAEVASNCPEILEKVAALYPSAIGSAPAGGVPVSRFVVMEVPEEPDGPRYQVWHEGRKLATFSSIARAVVDLEFRIFTASIPSLAPYALVHAGAVATAAGAVVFPGISRLGKSTLVATFCLDGFRYLSDEIAPVDIASGRLYPLLKPIRLRDGGFQALGCAGFEVPPSPVEHADPRDGHTLRYLVAPGPDPARQPVPVRCVLSLVRRPGPAVLAPKSRGLVLAEMAERSFNLTEHGVTAMETWAQLLEGAACYTLMYDDLRQAVDAVSAVVGHCPSG